MKKYKILCWLFLILALLGIAPTYFFIYYGIPRCPTNSQFPILIECPVGFEENFFLFGKILGFIDILFWLGFIYFLRKSKQQSRIDTNK